MATLLLLVLLLIAALWTHYQVMRGAGFLQHRSPEQRAALAKVIDVIFMALAVAIVLGSFLGGFFRGGPVGGGFGGLWLRAIAIVLIFLPLLHDCVAFLALKLEKEIEVGDFVECDRIRGYVCALSLRKTVIRTLEGCRVAIPNRFLLERPVHHWNGEGINTRIELPVEVPDSREPTDVKELLLDCARQISHIAKEPPPMVMFLGWRDRRLHFQLQVWIGDRAIEMETVSQLNYLIARRLRHTSSVNSGGKPTDRKRPAAQDPGAVPSPQEQAMSSGSLITPPPRPFDEPQSDVSQIEET